MRLSFVVALTLTSLFSVGEVRGQQFVPGGDDCWVTESGSQFALAADVPAGHFGSKGGVQSDVIPRGTIITVTGHNTILCPVPNVLVSFDQHGNVVAPNDKHKVTQRRVPGQVDTVVTRTRTRINGPTDVPVQLKYLSLKSTVPIRVTWGGALAELYNVYISHRGVSAAGSMRVTPTSVTPFRGTTNLNLLPVSYNIEFEHVGNTRPKPTSIAGSVSFNTGQGFLELNSAVIPAIGTTGIAILVIAFLATGAFLLSRRTISAPG